MRKLLTLFVTLLLISGCQAKEANFEEALRQTLARPLPVSTNHNKPYFKYYLPPNVGVKTSTELGSLLELDGHKIMLNLKVSQVVTSQYEETKTNFEKVEEQRILFSDFGHYIDNDDKEWQFRINIYNLKNDTFGLFLENDFVELVALATKEDYEFILENMMIILRSVDVEEEKIFLAYSNKEIIENKTIHEDFFEHVVPEDGNLIEMYNQMHPDDKIEE